jgi:hypothetical protein
MNYYLLTEATNAAVAASQEGSASLLTIVYIVGFLAAAGLGSVAWYNSKRPVGWEEKERPDIVPPIEK